VRSRLAAEIGTSIHVGTKKPVREPLSICGPPRKTKSQVRPLLCGTSYPSSTTRCSRPGELLRLVVHVGAHRERGASMPEPGRNAQP
jgi:hypothetical protein